LANLVIQRRREIGVRVALGAAQRDVVKLVVRRGMLLVLVGVGIGLAAAFGMTRLARGLLFGISATDPVHFFGIALLIGAVGLAASMRPARRAANADPVASLRD